MGEGRFIPPEKEERNEDVYKMRNSGATYTEIAKKHSISKGRASQIFKRLVRKKSKSSNPPKKKELPESPLSSD
jgi:DNA invertase Pin-like site-specific DNA recombinase